LDVEGNSRNILIDGGTAKTYQYKNHRGKLVDGDLKISVDKIKSNGEFIDLLILTHIDDDHIGGLLRWCENDNEFGTIVKSIWFNSGKLISEYFKADEVVENNIMINVRENNNTSILQSKTFEEFINQYNIWDKRLKVAGDTYTLFDTLRIKILSPTYEKLEPLNIKWEKELNHLSTAARNDYNLLLRDHLKNDNWKEDEQIFNGSSIAFILEYNGKSFAFLGDAHPSTILNGLCQFGYDEKNKLKVEFIKLSHHGSKANNPRELLNTIDTNNYIISSNSKIHGLPDKCCLARIIKLNPNANLFFNYPEIISKIFVKEDFDEFKFQALSIENQFTEL